MKQQAETINHEGQSNRDTTPMDWFILVLVLTFIAAFNSAAMQDRLLLILYSMGVAGAAFTLLKRNAYVFTAVTLAGASTALLVNVYFQAAAESWHPMLDAIRDFAGLSILAFGSVKLTHEAFRIQRETREAEMQRIFEKNLIAMRAAALRAASHEVRTPLTTIITVNETLMNGSTGPLTEIQQDFLQDIDDASRHLMDLVNDILDYAKAESGMITIVPELVAVVELVDQCVTMVTPKATEAGITVTAQVSPVVSEIVADPLRVKQILLNMLSNAIKYTDRDGMVSLRVRPDGERVVISVRDTGHGITPEHLPHLFNPYYQAAREDQSIGTGLGLAIVKHLTELHGGTVTVESIVGTGTVFTVSLPRKASIESEVTEASRESQALESWGDGTEKGEVLVGL
ncbi:MAG: sensor histidine kinase [Pirellulales bacterium]